MSFEIVLRCCLEVLDENACTQVALAVFSKDSCTLYIMCNVVYVLLMNRVMYFLS